jgi:translation initiation factor IF-3
MAHQEFGIRQLERVKADLEEVAARSSRFRRSKGSQMIMVHRTEQEKGLTTRQ